MTTATVTRLYTPKEAAERLPYCARTLVRFAREQRIGCVRPSPRKVLFRDEDIEAFIASSVKAPKTAEAKPLRNPKYSK